YNFVHLDFEKGNGTVFLRRWEERPKQWREDIGTYSRGQYPLNSLPKNLGAKANSATSTAPKAKLSISVPVQDVQPIGRETDVNKLKNRLGIADRRSKPNPISPLTIIRGWPGVGKTTLVTVLAHDDQINTAFSDAVVWIHLGQKPDVFS